MLFGVLAGILVQASARHIPVPSNPPVALLMCG